MKEHDVQCKVCWDEGNMIVITIRITKYVIQWCMNSNSNMVDILSVHDFNTCKKRVGLFNKQVWYIKKNHSHKNRL